MRWAPPAARRATSPTDRGSASCTPRRRPPASTARACATRCSCRDARCAACTATTPTPRRCASGSARRRATSSRRQVATGPSSRTAAGLTVTGGEPLLQPAFVEDLFVGVKDAYGLHTALDTSANGGHRASERLLANTDLVLLDIKAGNAALYERVSGGGSLSDVLAFGARLVDHQVKVWIRFVLVPGLTDGPDEIAEVADLAADLGEHRRSGRGPALPPARGRQVRRPRARLSPAGHANADQGVGGPGAGDLPRARPVRPGLIRAPPPLPRPIVVVKGRPQGGPHVHA